MKIHGLTVNMLFVHFFSLALLYDAWRFKNSVKYLLLSRLLSIFILGFEFNSSVRDIKKRTSS